MHSPEAAAQATPLANVPVELSYRPPRIDPQLLTIVVPSTPYARPTPLARSRKPNLRKRWS